MRLHVRVRRRAGVWRRAVCCALAAVPCALGAVAGAPAPAGHLSQAKQALVHARTHLRFGIAEHGNVQAYDATLESLDDAAAALRLAGQTREGTPSERTAMADDVRVVRSEAERLRSAARHFFHGRFPLARAMLPDDAAGAEGPTRYNLTGTARREALRSALAQVVRAVPVDILLRAVVLVPRADLAPEPFERLTELADSEAALAFASLPSVTLYPDALGDELGPAPPWDASDASFMPLCRSFVARVSLGSRPLNLMFIQVRCVDPAAEEAWFELQARIFEASAVAAALSTDTTPLAARNTLAGEGLCRDRTRFAVVMIVSSMLLLVVAIVVHGGLLVAGRQWIGVWREWLIPPALGYLLGLLTPRLTMTLLQPFAPHPTAPALDAAWWPCLAGMATLLTPAIVFRLGAKGLASKVGGLTCDGRWGVVLVSVALGVCGFWCRAAFLCLEWKALGVLLPLACGAALVLYTFGRAIDAADYFPMVAAIAAVALSLPLGAGAFLASPAVLWSIAAMMLSVALAGVAVGRKRAAGAIGGKPQTAKVAPAENLDAPRKLSELRASAEKPGYLPVDALREARERIEQAGPGKTVWLALCGPSGSGKTAVAQKLITDAGARKGELRLLAGNCRAETLPYQPFREALAEIWESFASAIVQPQAANIDSVFQELAGLFVPYWDVLTGLGHDTGKAATPNDLFASASAVLRKLAKKGQVVLFIDQIQWLDEASAALLRHLHQRLPPGGPCRIWVLLAGRDETSFSTLGLDDCTLPVAVPTPEEQVAFLTGDLRFEGRSAARIVEALGAIAQEPGGLFWLGRAIAELADVGALDATSDGFALRPDFLTVGKLPVPAELRKLLTDQLDRSPGDRLVLQCAALIGPVFSVSVLAASLAQDRLELLQILGRLDRQSHLLRDRTDDDQYGFASDFLHEVLCDELGMRGDGASSSKIAQELHARIALALEQRATRSATWIYDLARHYGEAGSLYARQAMECALRAARAARHQCAFDDARRYLAMAASAARVSGSPSIVDRQRLLIDCDEAHVTGRKRCEVAERGLGILPRQMADDPELMIAVARACYDAGRDTGDQAWFGRAAELASRVAQSDAADVVRAEGYHLCGVSLPRDRASERLGSLRHGLRLLEGAAAGEPPEQLLKARLLGSLAEQLSVGQHADPVQAKASFERGLALRLENQLGDLPGQARAHGGLGRLAFFSDPPDYDAARRHFLADLKISEEIDDAAGQSIVYSFLGKCDLAAAQPAGALEHFAAARQHAESVKDRLFAMAGMLESCWALGRAADADRIGMELAQATASTSVPRDCADEMARLLKTRPEASRPPWEQTLLQRISLTAGAAP